MHNVSITVHAREQQCTWCQICLQLYFWLMLMKNFQSLLHRGINIAVTEGDTYHVTMYRGNALQALVSLIHRVKVIPYIQSIYICFYPWAHFHGPCIICYKSSDLRIEMGQLLRSRESPLWLTPLLICSSIEKCSSSHASSFKEFPENASGWFRIKKGQERQKQHCCII